MEDEGPKDEENKEASEDEDEEEEGSSEAEDINTNIITERAGAEVSSDEDDLESGAFLQRIKQQTEKAIKERHFLMRELKAKERRGSIFVDRIKRIAAAVERAPGKYDFLIEWEYHSGDKITPSTTLVRGSHLVFSNPLLYRRYVEQNFVQGNKEVIAKK